MIRKIIRDPVFLAQKSEPATESDVSAASDLLDTLKANRDSCVGMAANMIGVRKRIIVFEVGGTYAVMFNPEIIKKESPYETEEGCLSLSGVRKAKRYEKIKVRFQNGEFQARVQTFEGLTAQIIQHETDHCDGILI